MKKKLPIKIALQFVLTACVVAAGVSVPPPQFSVPAEYSEETAFLLRIGHVLGLVDEHHLTAGAQRSALYARLKVLVEHAADYVDEVKKNGKVIANRDVSPGINFFSDGGDPGAQRKNASPVEGGAHSFSLREVVTSRELILQAV